MSAHFNVPGNCLFLWYLIFNCCFNLYICFLNIMNSNNVREFDIKLLLFILSLVVLYTLVVRRLKCV